MGITVLQSRDPTFFLIVFTRPILLHSFDNQSLLNFTNLTKITCDVLDRSKYDYSIYLIDNQTLSLNFEYSVSFNPLEMRATINHPEFFRDINNVSLIGYNTNRNNSNNSVLNVTFQVSLYLKISPEGRQSINDFYDKSKIATYTVLLSSAIPFYCFLTLQFFWFMVDSMQISNLFLYLNIVLPENVSKILFLFAEANLYFFSTLISRVFGINTTNSNFSSLENPLIKAPEKFDILGISSLYLSNAGAVILITLSIYLLFGIISLVDFLYKYMELKNYWVRATINQIKIYYNLPVIIRMQSVFLMGISMATCLQIRSFSTLNSEYYFNYIFAFLSVIYIAIYLYVVFKISNNEHTFFKDDEYLKFYSPIFKESNMEIFLGRNLFFLISVKKIIISINLVFFYDWPYFTLSFLLCLQILEISLIMKYNVFNNKIMNYFMRFADIILLLAIIMLFVLKIYFDCVVSQTVEIPVDVVQVFFNLGWALIGIILSLVFIYFLLMNWSLVKLFKSLFQRCKSVRKNKKYEESPTHPFQEISSNNSYRNENSKII